MATGTVAAVGGPASGGVGPVEDPRRRLRYQGLERGADDGPCRDKFQVKTGPGRDGPARCTHGPDPAPEGVDVRVAREPETPATAAALQPEAVAAAEAPACSGDGTSGPRVQLVYANIAGGADRYAAYASSFRVWAGAMDSVFDASAAQTGGGRRIRFVHDASCRPTVLRTTLSAAARDDFQATIDELVAKGFKRNDRKYVVWMDANVYCGIGEVFSDDRAGQNNYNNVYGLFSRVDNGCWGLAGQSVEAHELMHNLGGVQESAPHSTPYNHRRPRLMCYADGSGKTVTQVCPSSNENLFDCNHHDYFHTSPPAGSYLATHWNTADSAWLMAVAGAAPPSAPHGRHRRARRGDGHRFLDGSRLQRRRRHHRLSGHAARGDHGEGGAVLRLDGDHPDRHRPGRRAGPRLHRRRRQQRRHRPAVAALGVGRSRGWVRATTRCRRPGSSTPAPAPARRRPRWPGAGASTSRPPGVAASPPRACRPWCSTSPSPSRSAVAT